MKLKKYISLVLIICGLLFSFSVADSPNNLTDVRNTYCVKPPFLQEDIYANLMLVIDSSGSMSYDAYYDSYDSNKIYQGYFKYNAYYYEVYYNEDSYYWEIALDNQSPPFNEWQWNNDKKTYIYSGNYLNWLYMKRIDVIRWVLTGGKTTTVNGKTVVELYNGQKILFTDVTSYNPDPKIKHTEGVLQKIQRLSKRPRIGAYFYQNSSVTQTVSPSDNYDNLIDAINNKSVYGSTPTIYAMEDVRLYFSREDGIHGGFSTNDEDYIDPYKFTINGKQQDVPCTKNYALLLTDGLWNTGGDPLSNVYNMWKGGKADLVSELNNNQNVKVYTVALFMDEGEGKNAVKHMAIFGGFDDLDNNNWPCGYNGLVNSQSNVVDITDSQYSLCRNEWDADHDGLPDTYASGETPEKVKEAIEKIFEAILKDLASGTSSSILPERNMKGALVLQAVFYPKKKINGYKTEWIGNMYSYWFLNTRKAQNIREDTNQDEKLSINDDRILEFKITDKNELEIDVYDSDSTGNKTSTPIAQYKSLDEIKYLWQAGEPLAKRNSDSRTIKTVSESGNLVDFTTSNSSSFDSYLGSDPNLFPKCLKNGNVIDYDKLIRYARGEDIPGCRKRQVGVDSNGDPIIWKLGDIIYSSPKAVDYQDYTVVFTGANDGMLHAFKAGKVEQKKSGNYLAELTDTTDLGKELWAFIPKNVLPYLRFLADPKYCHIYMHDLSPYIVKVDYDNDNDEELVLIGGLRLGGGCNYQCSGSNCAKSINPPSDMCNKNNCVGLSEYYALDITNPTSPKLLWEFSNSDLGFSYSGPGVIKASDGNYYVIFGSGPVNYTAQFDSDDTKTLKFFVVKLSDGTLEKTIDTGISKAFSGRIFSRGFDYNGDGYTDYLAVGYTVQDNSKESYKGGIIVLGGEKTTDNKLKPFDGSNWNYKELTFYDKNNNLNSLEINPVTAKVEFMQCSGKWYMYFGSGRWFAKNDEWEASTNAIYGVPINTDGTDISAPQLIDVTNINNTGEICSNTGSYGWYINLLNSDSTNKEGKEKIITDPTGSDNIAVFVSIRPNSDVCSLGGKTRVWTLNCATGGAPKGCGSGSKSTVEGTILLQLSGGDIQQIKMDKDTRVSNWYTGIAPENAPPIIKYTGSYTGEILLWLEK